MGLEPAPQLHILLHPAPAGVDQQETQRQAPAIRQIRVDQRLPGIGDLPGNSRVPIAGQINERPPVFDPEEIDGLRSARSGTGMRQSFFPGQSV